MSYNKTDNTYDGYIYLITNLINQKKYVGLTTVTIQERWRKHIASPYAKSVKDRHVIDRAIAKYGADSFSVEQLAVCSASSREELHDELDYMERYYIKIYNTLINFGHGYNVDEGGNSGTINKIPVKVFDINGNYIKTFASRLEASEYYGITDSIIIDICKGKKANFDCKLVFRNEDDPFDLYDITLHPMYKNLYQFSLDGKLIANYHSCKEVPYDFRWRIYEVVDDINKTCGGFWWGSTSEYKYNGNKYCKRIKLFHINGAYIKTFNSISECARYCNVSNAEISACCQGKQHRCKQYVARYEFDDFNKYSIIPRKKKVLKVNQYDLNNNFIKSFASQSEAAKEMNVSLSSINACCNHKRNQTAGYRWYLEGDSFQYH